MKPKHPAGPAMTLGNNVHGPLCGQKQPPIAKGSWGSSVRPTGLVPAGRREAGASDFPPFADHMSTGPLATV